MTDGPRIPAYSDLPWPSLCAVREIGDSGTNEEIVEKVIATEGFTDEQLGVPSNDGRRGLIEYRLAWARSYLKGMGLLDNSRRGVWSTTDLGRSCTAADIPALYASYTSQLREAQRQKRAAHEGEDPSEPLGEHDVDVSSPWKEQLISTLLEISPEQFERLARRLLREAGFVSAKVTGKAGDGGIDGIGVYRLSLLSFPYLLPMQTLSGQRWRGRRARLPRCHERPGGQGPPDNHGTYTADATREATRDGAPPIDLIDGDQLCDLLRQYELGVRCTMREIEDVVVDSAFFVEL